LKQGPKCVHSRPTAGEPGADAVAENQGQIIVSHRFLLVLTAAALVSTGAFAARTAATHGAHGAHPAASAQSTQTANAAPTASHAITQGAVAIVNDTVISDYDLQQRIALFFVTSGMPHTAENEALIRAQVLSTLEDETLQVKEAQAHGITVSKDEIDQDVALIAKENNTTPEGIEQTLAKGGVQMGTFRSQLMAQIAWQKVIQGKFGSRLDVRDEEVAAAIARIKEGADKPQFRVSEIFLGIDKPEDEAKVRANAEQLVAQIKSGTPFATMARQVSQSPSAASGGDIGGVIQGQLSDEVDKALATMHRGDVAGPIRSTGGYYILQLRSRLEPAGTQVAQVVAGPPTGPVPLARFLLPLPQNAPAEYRQKALTFAADISQHVTSCPQLQAIATKVHAVYMPLGTIDPKGLSTDVQSALAKTVPGGIAQPFVSAAGIEEIARCDPRVDPQQALVIPTPEEMKNQLFQQRAGNLARSYLRDLRRDAIIETR
jgi:peptidyl-prolyl cis-trans isomerase SurA